MKKPRPSWRARGGKAALIAGGTDLMIDIRDGKFKGEALVDVKGIAEMRELKEDGGRISIGAAVSIEELRQSELVRKKLPALAKAADKFAGLQIRNQGTIGGNVGHAAPCGDTHPPIILYDGQVELATPNGRKTVQLGDTLAGPNRSALKEDELIVRFILTPQTAALADFQKIGRRKDLAISRVSLAMMIDKDASGNINLAKVVLGACMPTTRRMPKTEARLMGQKPSWDLFKEAAALMAAEMIEITGRRASIVYKEPAIQGLFLRIAMPLVKGD
ncbi:FAD binding domain-containing protein [Deltaproteobacteria bacterium OttesenSCG-928-K17]|nr:FAD binding domain-containing protein [Deltaproteobacteria bacterium OttesenSCG-928-K17]